jgi:hypothetical protein
MWVLWCRDKGRSPQPWLKARLASWINATLASVVFVTVVIPTLDATDSQPQEEEQGSRIRGHKWR